MDSPARLPVILLWHMHQPQYRDALTGEEVLPWTYLHAIKDYTDMAAHLEENPAACAVVNFTPVLLDQLDELARRVRQHLAEGTPLADPVLSLLGPGAVPTQPAARLALLNACMRAHRHNLIERFPAFLALVTHAEQCASLERISWASDALIHDLAVWFHLAWMGETVRRTDPRVAALSGQSCGFTPAQRRELLELIGELLAAIIPRYRRLREAGQCELSVTPYAHPILPLLFDFAAAHDSDPRAPLPRHPGYPGGAARAQWHVTESIRAFEQYFGVRPAGCWPAEGAINEPTLRLLDAQGFKWVASGATVLRASLNASQLNADAIEAYNRPYQLPGTALNCFFREEGLSDLIGFTYATWHGDDAANNLVHDLVEMAQGKNTAGPTHAVLIALDGENAWEYYPFNGYWFLKALYAGLAANPQLELMTLSQCLARGIAPLPLQRVQAGSWVHGNLATWIGEPAKNFAWDLLCDAKRAFDAELAAGTLEPQARAAVTRQLALCESSDWFWWLGDYNPAEAVSQFDQLYRRQLQNLYQMLGRAAPDALSRPISVGSGAMDNGGVMRRAQAAP
ncbi:MAG TPA: glycoside hydrolase family 57 protein [Steroidobacteraceae bacterium]|jgi:alpha-amylase/alpha-mannosidase (GH57 family)|nr:glycoside hydrolase family 57 protein [Steroidobacteraceae bacterium]